MSFPTTHTIDDDETESVTSTSSSEPEAESNPSKKSKIEIPDYPVFGPRSATKIKTMEELHTKFFAGIDWDNLEPLENDPMGWVEVFECLEKSKAQHHPKAQMALGCIPGIGKTKKSQFPKCLKADLMDIQDLPLFIKSQFVSLI